MVEVAFHVGRYYYTAECCFWENTFCRRHRNPNFRLVNAFDFGSELCAACQHSHQLDRLLLPSQPDDSSSELWCFCELLPSTSLDCTHSALRAPMSHLQSCGVSASYCRAAYFCCPLHRWICATFGIILAEVSPYLLKIDHLVLIRC